MNRKVFTVLAVLIISLLYSIPNLYPDKPTIIFHDTIDQQVISTTLSAQGYHHEWTKGNHLNLQDVDDQIKARDYLKQKHPLLAMSLNLEKSTPAWLNKIGAHAMKLGLDLQGGIHFLLEVDTSHIEKSRGDNNIQKIRELLKEHRLRYRDVQQNGASISIELYDVTLLAEAATTLEKILPNHLISLNESHIIVENPNGDDSVAYAVNQTIHSLEKRINELGISEATIQRQGDRYISIDLPGIQDIVYAKKIIGKTATLRLHMVNNNPNSALQLADQDGQLYSLNEQTILSGDSISFAHAKLNDSRPVVEIQLNGQANKFYQATAQNIGKRLAVVYSEVKQDATEEFVISAPVIQQALGDNFIITGSKSLSEAKELALLLRSGALAAPVKFIEETTIGPSLGSDNIQKGIFSLLAGSSIIFIFMAYYYRFFGLIANVALLLNIIMIVAILSILGATLTLPGIAGIVLSVGMAVDANVLINERIREETQMGASISKAISLGYEKALSAIVDANVTTLLVTLVLFSLGSGVIKGFAITTCMGILASIFSSVYFTQALTELLVAKGIIKEVSLSHDWFSKIPKIDFLKISRPAFMLSAIILGSSLLMLPIKGINLGLDFTGGQQLTMVANENTHPVNVRDALSAIGIEQAQVQTYGSAHTFLIKIGQTDRAIATTASELESAISGSRIIHAEFIGPQVGSSMLKSSLIAVASALAVTMVYVAIRFEYRFATSAIISLIHDPILILGIFSLTQIEFNLIALAAMLTILGYSINDTIVVYDRVRENFKASSELCTKAVINDAINQTLSRTVLTSCLTLAVVIALYLFGGDYLHGFSLSLAIGIVIGTYSSIYIAGSLAVKLGLKRDDLIPQPSTGELYEP